MYIRYEFQLGIVKNEPKVKYAGSVDLTQNKRFNEISFDSVYFVLSTGPFTDCTPNIFQYLCALDVLSL